MRRGTTPVHTFATDADLTGASVLYVTYQQRGETVLEKSLGDAGVTVTEAAVTVELTQDESLSFAESVPVRIQIRAGWADGTRAASNIVTASVGEILKEGAI